MKGLPQRFWVLILLATGTVVLGTLGLLGRGLSGSSPDPGPGHFFDAVLEAISYLTLNGFNPIDPDTDGWGNLATWSIRAARVLALVFVITGISVLVDALLGEFGSWRFRWRAQGPFSPRRLDLVCGLAGPGLSFIHNTCLGDQGDNKHTLAIDAGPSTKAIDICQRMGVPLMVGDAGDASVLARLKLERIARVFVSTGSDDANLRIVFLLAEHTRSRNVSSTQSRMLCVVHLDDTVHHAPLLKALPPDHNLDLRIFNTESVTVRELYRLHPLDRFHDQSAPHPGSGVPPTGIHLVVVGDGAMADELLLQAQQLNVYEPSLSLRVDVLCRHPGQAADHWQSRHVCHPHRTYLESGGILLSPEAVWKSENVLPSIGFHPLPGAARAQIAWCETHCGQPGWTTTFVIALQDPNAAAASALGLVETLRTMRGQGVELWIYLRNGNLENVRRLFDAADIANGGEGWIRLFGDYLGECSRDLAVASQIEAAAQRVNLIYNLPPEARGAEFLADQAAATDFWHACDEAHRDSSRQAAAHAWIKQRIAARLDLQRELDHAVPSLREYVGNDPVKLLATVEHRRWCAQQLLAGMTPLLTHPTAATTGQWNADDLDIARAWFGSSEVKKSWQRRNRHADLMPFASLAHFNALDIHEAMGATMSLGDREQAKDVDLARLTHYITGGRAAAAE
ncbi:NAD-binding protein [uncultured Luteimonas sp.]|uniref:NAD-binding protein n=1 Tax=uncultured Luteimonas sp. TaxID=453144 RepID=UPI002607C2FF|nr:NAD-binding protein [uncultured Luteimonas sp.]